MRKALVLTFVVSLALFGFSSAALIVLDGNTGDWPGGLPSTADPTGDVFCQVYDPDGVETFRDHLDVTNLSAVIQGGYLYILIEYADDMPGVAGDPADIEDQSVRLYSSYDSAWGKQGGEDIGEDKVEYTDDAEGAATANEVGSAWPVWRTLNDTDLNSALVTDAAGDTIFETTDAALAVLVAAHTVDGDGEEADARNSGEAYIDEPDSGYISFFDGHSKLSNTSRYWRRYDDICIDWDDDLATGDVDANNRIEKTPGLAEAIGTEIIYGVQIRSDGGNMLLKGPWMGGATDYWGGADRVLGENVAVEMREISTYVADEVWKGNVREVAISIAHLNLAANMNGLPLIGSTSVLGIGFASDGTPWDVGMEAAEPVHNVAGQDDVPLPVEATSWGSVKNSFR